MRKFKIIRRLILLLIVFGLIGLGYYTYAVSPTDYQFSTYEYKNKNINSKLNGFKIAFITDTHLTDQKSLDRFDKIIDKLNTYPFDMVIFGGDLFDSQVFSAKDVSNALKSIECKYGKFAILGEKDEAATLEVTQVLNNGGFEVLKNEARDIYYKDATFSLIASDINNDITKIKTTTKTIKVCISHQPDSFIANNGNIDLQLSGHSNGGSLYIPYYGPLMPITGAKTYNHGLYELGSSTLLVSNGVTGPSSLPYKFFARNEINFITLNVNSAS
ncbi:MAG: metallophosphoesterase [Coprobacillus sp.]